MTFKPNISDDVEIDSMLLRLFLLYFQAIKYIIEAFKVCRLKHKASGFG
jgi:hypothetical protein